MASSGAVCVAWDGYRHGAPHDAEEIFLSCSRDQGATWGAPLNVSSSPSVMSTRPALAIGDDGILHMAWQELAGSNPEDEYEIYYAHSLPKALLLPIIRKEVPGATQ